MDSQLILKSLRNPKVNTPAAANDAHATVSDAVKLQLARDKARADALLSGLISRSQVYDTRVGKSIII